MASANPLFVHAWYQRLLTLRATWESIWSEQADYLTPNKSGIITQRSPGAKATEKLFDGTGMRALKRLAANLHGSLTSTSMKWFALRMRDEELNRIKSVSIWLDDSADRMLNAFNQSNFASEAQELYVDMAAFGTGSLFTEEVDPPAPGRFGGLRFTALPIGSYVIDENPYGIVDVIMRKTTMNARNLGVRFPNASFPREVLEAIEKKPEQPFDIVHAIYPREGGVNTIGVDARELRYASCYILVANKGLLEEGGFHEFPAPTPRWSKMSGETWGRGPGHEALPDVKTANRAVELTLKAWAKAIDPPLVVANDGVLGGVVRTNPSGITYAKDAEKSVVPLKSGTEWRAVELQLELIQQAIREAFFVDQLNLKESPQMTAEEVRARVEQMQKMLGPTLGRIEAEFLNPLIQRVFNIMFRAGALLPPPQEVLNAIDSSAGDIDVEYTGPLAKNQRIGEVYAIQRAYEIATTMATAKQALPSIDDVYDADEALRITALTLGVPERVVRDPKTVMQIRQNRAEEEAEQRQIDQQRVDAGTAKDLAAASEKFGNRPMMRVPDEEEMASMLSA